MCYTIVHSIARSSPRLPKTAVNVAIKAALGNTTDAPRARRRAEAPQLIALNHFFELRCAHQQTQHYFLLG